MKAKEFLERVTELTGRNEKDVRNLLDIFRNITGENLYCGNAIKLPGLGTFMTRLEDEKIVTDDTDGKRYLYPPTVNIEFRAASTLLLKLREKNQG